MNIDHFTPFPGLLVADKKRNGICFAVTGMASVHPGVAPKPLRSKVKCQFD
jgi:hypothetical protein